MTKPVSINRETTQTERAIFGVRELVLQGVLHSGERLSEVELAERLSVSRTPIRAALQRLAEEGLLEALQPTGYTVRGFTETDIYDAIEVRGTVEALAARMAAEGGVTRPMLCEMRDCLARIDAALSEAALDSDSLAKYAEFNAHFHSLMIDAAGSEMVRRALARVVCLPFASPNAFVLVQARIPGAFELLKTAQMQHYDIVEAIENRSSGRVEALVREHSRIARKNLQLVLRNAESLREVPGAQLIRRRAVA